MPKILTASNIPSILHQCMQKSQLKHVVFSQVTPDTEVAVPTIVWHIRRRVPGNEGKETRKHRFRYKDSENPEQDTLYFGQWQTVIYQFDLYTTSDPEGNKLMEDFEQFIMESTPALVRSGVQTFIFDEQLKDFTLVVPPNTSVRSLCYLAVFTAVQSVYLPRIRDITLSVALDAVVCTDTILRGSTGDIDYLPETEEIDGIAYPLKIRSLVSISDTELVGADYIQEVDYTIAVDSNTGRVSIVWLLGGKHPLAGVTYYVTYIKVENLCETSLLKTL